MWTSPNSGSNQLQLLREFNECFQIKEHFPDDDFFDGLIRSQSRLDDQRSSVRPGVKARGPQVRTIPDEDFFKSLLK